MFLLSEELREGIGPAIVKAKDMLMFILRFGELTTTFVLPSTAGLVTYPRQSSQLCWAMMLCDRQLANTIRWLPDSDRMVSAFLGIRLAFGGSKSGEINNLASVLGQRSSFPQFSK